MRRTLNVALAAILSTYTMPVIAYGANKVTQSATWGSIKAMYSESSTAGDSLSLTLEQLVNQLQDAATDEEAQAILNSAPSSVVEQLMQSEGATSSPSEPAWMHPLASEAAEKFGISTLDVLAVQRVVMLSNGIPIDSADVVVTDDQWYYKSLVDHSFSTSPESIPFTTEMDIYGSNIESVSGWLCSNLEWVVTFYLPVCFHEISPGRFDGIIDSWAPNPNCSSCNGGWCIGNACGSAWDGAGYLGWWDYHTCSSTWTQKAGKLVQKRWLYTWRNCGYADWQIASWVRTRIQY